MSIITLTLGQNGRWGGNVVAGLIDTDADLIAACQRLQAHVTSLTPPPNPDRSATGKPRTYSDRLEATCQKLLQTIKHSPELTWSRIQKIFKGTRLLVEARDQLLKDGRAVCVTRRYDSAAGRRLTGEFLRVAE